METADFQTLVESGLLKDVEEIVVRGYLRAHPEASRPEAYHWLRYEDPDPVERLAEGVKRLLSEGVQLEGDAVDKACAKASARGLLN